jgi:sulfur relay (sulfurtransferase) DsrC/TusE family protein
MMKALNYQGNTYQFDAHKKALIRRIDIVDNILSISYDPRSPHTRYELNGLFRYFHQTEEAKRQGIKFSHFLDANQGDNTHVLVHRCKESVEDAFVRHYVYEDSLSPDAIDILVRSMEKLEQEPKLREQYITPSFLESTFQNVLKYFNPYSLSYPSYHPSYGVSFLAHQDKKLFKRTYRIAYEERFLNPFYDEFTQSPADKELRDHIGPFNSPTCIASDTPFLPGWQQELAKDIPCLYQQELNHFKGNRAVMDNFSYIVMTTALVIFGFLGCRKTAEAPRARGERLHLN